MLALGLEYAPLWAVIEMARQIDVVEGRDPLPFWPLLF
jgi:hypothetical protein